MWKQFSCFVAISLISSILITGCNASDEYSSSKEDMTSLLGVDANNNGVRDDVEAYINKRFQGFDNAEKDRAIAMQYARATQIIIQNPKTAYEQKTYVVMHDVIDCAWYYYETSGTTFEEIIAFRNKHQIYDPAMKDVIFNTRERLEAYMQYNDSLSGHVYDSRPRVLKKCEVNIDAL